MLTTIDPDDCKVNESSLYALVILAQHDLSQRGVSPQDVGGDPLAPYGFPFETCHENFVGHFCPVTTNLSLTRVMSEGSSISRDRPILLNFLIFLGLYISWMYDISS